MSIDRILGFIELLNQYRSVERTILVKGKERVENDAEHAYDLAMLCWYVISTYNLPLDISKVMKYALSHDIVEIYAGDTWAYHTDISKHAGKHERELESAKKIAGEFPEFADLHQTIQEYELKQDPESKFVYALDKLEPVMKIYLDKGRNWKKHDITFEKMKENKGPKVASDQTIEKLYTDLLEYLKASEKDLFPEK
jgi:putative hydrolases of HD superfamily